MRKYSCASRSEQGKCWLCTVIEGRRPDGGAVSRLSAIDVTEDIELIEDDRGAE